MQYFIIIIENKQTFSEYYICITVNISNISLVILSMKTLVIYYT